MDALTHCIEAYANRFAHPLVDFYALEGIRLIAGNLARAVAQGNDLEARTALALGSMYGGMCLGPVNTAAVHALSYPLGSEFRVAHGVSNAVLLPHVLEFSENPHQTLREAERVLVPEGHIMISGFNPISTWGLKRLAAGREGYPWDGNFLPLLRIKDWLALLGFELTATRMACYAPPCRNPAWLGRFRGLDKAGDRWWPMMGGIYFIVAKKRVLGMRLIRPNWQATKLKPRLVATPSQKNDMKTDGQ